MTAHESRLARIRERMRAAGLDLLVVYSNGRHTMLDFEPVLYFSGFKPMGPHSAILLPLEGQPLLVVTPSWDRDRAERRSMEVRVVGTDDFAATFGRLIAECRFEAARAGVVGYGRLSKAWRGSLRGQFALPPVPFDREFDEVAGVRDELEMSLSARAAEIADRGFEHLLETARPGMREYELAAEVDWLMKSLGADDNFQLLAASQHNLAVRPPGDRRLDVGDVILGEISPSVGGQFVQICRTAVLGPASDLQRDRHALLVEAMKAAMETGAAGARVSEVAMAINRVISGAGYGQYCYPPYMRARGHGFGLGSMMPGEVSEQNDTVLRAGMTFVLHPNQYVPETGYMLVGEPVVVTENGLRTLTGRPLGLAEIPV